MKYFGLEKQNKTKCDDTETADNWRRAEISGLDFHLNTGDNVFFYQYKKNEKL